MQPVNVIEQLVGAAMKSELPKSFKSEVVLELEKLRTEALCDLDQRKSFGELRAIWEKVNSRTRSLGIFDQVFKDQVSKLTFEYFVGFKEPSSVLNRLQGKPKENFFDKWEASDIFLELSKNVDSVPVVSRDEKMILFLGLKYLQLEAERTGEKRNQKMIRAVWNEITPLIERLGLLRKLQSQAQLLKKLEFFLK